MLLHLKIIGALLTTLGLAHAVFPRYFDWKNDLASLSLINRQVMQTHNFFIAFVVVGLGVLCLTSGAELTTTPLGSRICLFFSAFWGIRLIFQHFVYAPELWRGKLFETIVHILFTAIWIYMTVVFYLAAGV